MSPHLTVVKTSWFYPKIGEGGNLHLSPKFYPCLPLYRRPQSAAEIFEAMENKPCQIQKEVISNLKIERDERTKEMWECIWVIPNERSVNQLILNFMVHGIMESLSEYKLTSLAWQCFILLNFLISSFHDSTVFNNLLWSYFAVAAGGNPNISSVEASWKAFKGIDRSFKLKGESRLIWSVMTNWRLGNFFYFILKGHHQKISKRPLDAV